MNMIPVVVVSEMGKAQTHVMLKLVCVVMWGQREYMSGRYKFRLVITYVSRTALERAAIESDSLVDEDLCKACLYIPSIMEHVEFRENQSRPWDKAKYYLMTDSEQVP